MRDSGGADRQARRLLVITFHYPPDGSVGGLRWAGMAKYLARRGWEIHVVTAAAQGGEPVEPGVHVHYCPRGRTLNDVYNHWAARLRSRTSWGSAGGPETARHEPPGGRTLLSRLRENAGSVLSFPDEGRGWVLRAARLARTLRRAQPFRVVVSSGPPHSAHVAGLLACTGWEGEFWVDMRDPWAAMSGASWARDVFGDASLRAVIPAIERTVFRRAHRIVTNTEEFANALRRTYPEMEISFIPNAIDRERLPPPAEKFKGLSIAYAGTLYAGRTVTPVIHALELLLARHPEAKGQVKLRIAGVMDEGPAAQFWRDVTATGLTESVEAYGNVSVREALNLVNRSHLGLVLAQDQPVQVPAKLYECVGMGVPTLVLAEPSSSAAREGKRVGAVVCEPTDHQAIAALLERLWRNAAPGDIPSPNAAIGYEHSAAQMEALLLRMPVSPKRP